MTNHYADGSTTEPTVSVIVPTHNRPGGLGEALQSILSQSLQDFEVIVIDDGSSPPASPVDDPRIRCHRTAHSEGPGAARNRGIASASGRYLSFLDDDDVYHPEKLRIAVEALEANPDCAYAVHRMTFRELDTSPRGSGDQSVLREGTRPMLLSQPPHVDSVVLRRDMTADLRFDETFPAAADLDYMIRLARCGPQLFIDSVLGAHTTTGRGQVSAVGLEKRLQGRQMLLDRYPEEFADPAVRAFYLLRLGHLYRRSGQRLKALRVIGQGLRIAPRSLQLWKALAYLGLPRGLVHRLTAK